MKSLGDTSAVIDYNTCNELMAANLNISYHGSWNAQSPDVLVAELTSFITVASADEQKYAFAQVVFDSLAFADYNAATTYSLPRAITTVSLDSIGIYIGISGDTVAAHGVMANDSLVIDIYRVSGDSISTIPVKTIINAGYSGLHPFLTGPAYMNYVHVPVGQQFNTGESFAVRVTYLNKDTSSHCLLSFSYADSCGTVDIQGVSYPSPAYPPLFAHSTGYGQIDSINPATATVHLYDNELKYNMAGVPSHCQYAYIQNWQILAYVTTRANYSAQLQTSANTFCGSSSVWCNAIVLGNDSATVHYTWAATGGAQVLNADSSATQIILPPSLTSNVTVTLTVNNGSGAVTQSAVLVNCHQTLNDVLTNRRIYNFSVGDTFVYKYETINSDYNYDFIQYNRFVVLQKTFSALLDTIFYGFGDGNSANVISTAAITNLDSVPVFKVFTSDTLCFSNYIFDSTLYTGRISNSAGETCFEVDTNYTFSEGLGRTRFGYGAPAWSGFGCDCYGEELIYFSDGITHIGTPVSVESDFILNAGVSLYPNPTTGMCTLHITNSNEQLTAVIYDLTGREILPLFSGRQVSTFQFNTGNISPGIYLVKVSDSSGKKEIVKLIKT